MPATKKQKKAKMKRFALVLTERETQQLSRYARSKRCTRPVALKRIVKQALREYAQAPAEVVAKNQLSLFDINNQTNLLDIIPAEDKQ